MDAAGLACRRAAPDTRGASSPLAARKTLCRRRRDEGGSASFSAATGDDASAEELLGEDDVGNDSADMRACTLATAPASVYAPGSLLRSVRVVKMLFLPSTCVTYR